MTAKPRPLRVAIVAAYDLSSPGGVNAQIRQQAEALRGLGHWVTVFGPASNPRALASGEVAIGGSLALNIGGTVSGMGWNPWLYRQVRAALEDGRFDVLHIHEPLMPLLPWLFLVAARRTPIVGTFHVYREGKHPFYRAFWPLLRLLVRRVDQRLAVSPAARDTVSRFFPGEYEVLPNGIEVARFSEPAPRPEAFDGRRNILFLGRLEERKGLPGLLQAMPRVQAAAPDAQLVVAGDGPDRARCERLAAGLGVNAHFAGAVSEADKAAYFQAADVYCTPATGGESFGVVLLEAMAAGTPVVASAIDGYSAVLGPTAGLLTPPGDPVALGDALIRVLTDDSLRQRLSAGARATAAPYDWPALARRLEEVYRQIINEPTLAKPSS